MASIENRGDSYRIKVSMGYDCNGKQVFQKKTWKPEPGMKPKDIEKELNRQAVLFEEDCKRGLIVSAEKFEALAEEWFEQYARPNYKNTSFVRTLQLRDRVYPALGHYRIDKLNTRIIQKFINSLTAEGVNQRTGKGLSHKTMVHHLTFISNVYEYAITMGMVSDNPCKRVKVPKTDTKEIEVFTIEQTEEFLKLIETAPLKYRVFFMIDMYTGFRTGEVLGLEWRDINFETGIIRIRRASNYTSEQGIYTDTPKTERSKRPLKVPQEILNLLLLYKAQQDEERIKMGSKWIDHDRLFVKVNGEPMNTRTPYGWLKDFCRRNNFPFHGVHHFRHLFASLLINAGVDIASISAALGHSQISTTLNKYSHLFAESQAVTCDAISNALNFVKK